MRKTGELTYATVELCCSTRVYWMSGEDCKILSEGGTIEETAPTGTNGWYYGGGSKCVKDCPQESDSVCGGVELYQQVFSSLQDCCSTKVTWVKMPQCVQPRAKVVLSRQYHLLV